MKAWSTKKGIDRVFGKHCIYNIKITVSHIAMRCIQLS